MDPAIIGYGKTNDSYLNESRLNEFNEKEFGEYFIGLNKENKNTQNDDKIQSNQRENIMMLSLFIFFDIYYKIKTQTNKLLIYLYRNNDNNNKNNNNNNNNNQENDDQKVLTPLNVNTKLSFTEKPAV